MENFLIINTKGDVIIELRLSVEHYHKYKINMKNYNRFIADSVKDNKDIDLITKNIEEIIDLVPKYFDDNIHDTLERLCSGIGLNLMEILE